GREPDTNQGQRSANPRTMSTDGWSPNAGRSVPCLFTTARALTRARFTNSIIACSRIWHETPAVKGQSRVAANGSPLSSGVGVHRGPDGYVGVVGQYRHPGGVYCGAGLVAAGRLRGQENAQEAQDGPAFPRAARADSISATLGAGARPGRCPSDRG